MWSAAPFGIWLLGTATLQAQDPRGALATADRALADSVRRSGLPALGRLAVDRFLYLHPGAPVVQGREASRLMAEIPGPDGAVGQWAPLHVEVSADGSFGVSFGVTVSRATTAASDTPLRFGNYLAAWRREHGAWRLLALAFVGGAVRALEGSTSSSSTPRAITEAGQVFARADREFAAMAGRDGAPRAFEMFAAPDAVIFPGAGELIRGPAEIRAALEAAPEKASWVWEPVAGDGAADGSLGFTVGEAVINRTRPDGSGITTHSKYLSLWRKDRQGNIRFLADGGNVRP